MTNSKSEIGSYVAKLEELTLAEKVSLLSGSDFMRTTSVPRVGIPSIKLVDSINGVKGSEVHAGVPTAIFPSSTCYGSTWNRDLMHKLGVGLAAQAKLKSAQAVLGPTINIHRDPRGGRNFECFSEDPLLSGQLGAAIVNGLQQEGVSSCPKHFVCNDSEFQRRWYNVTETQNSRAAREIYMAAFQELLRHSSPFALMISYNKLDGIYTTEHPFLKDILRDEWHYSKCLLSDWYATRSCEQSVKAGTDLEMPGPSVFRGKRLLETVKKGLVDESIIDERAAAVLGLLDDTRDSYADAPEKVVEDPSANELIRKVASEGIVLLKNQNDVLPLNPVGQSKLAVIGMHAVQPAICGGGSASAAPQYLQQPLECLKESLSDPSQVTYTLGVSVNRLVPPVPLVQSRADNGEPGFDVRYYSLDHKGPVAVDHVRNPAVNMVRQLIPGLEEGKFYFEISTKLTPKFAGEHVLAVRVTGAFELFLDDELVLSSPQYEVSMENFLFEPFLLERRVQVPMREVRPYAVKLVMQNRIAAPGDYEPNPHGACLCFQEFTDDEQAIADAVSVAASSDTTIIYAGRTSEYESEGYDLADMALPGLQASMIKAVAAASKRTVLVLYCGNPVDLSEFVDDVDAIILAHYPGQEGGRAVTDVILGEVNPSGKLATTWRKKLDEQHVPSFNSFSARLTDEGYTVDYTEGIKVGYRAPNTAEVALFPFGFGLSYTSFTYSNLNIDEVDDSNVSARVTVENTGDGAGYEVVQLYITPPADSSVWRPARELKGFDKVWLEVGESKQVEIELVKKYACSFWDESSCKWKMESGVYGVVVGDLAGQFTVASELMWTGV
ncbi:putative glycosyl hydrolase [Myxozyma melibiosi]|uniref:beta-glucosidase n=1 Tax=Myxozyma melibiosi TaxID=54550 RepID=A0ABR1EXV7_9ASCO